MKKSLLVGSLICFNALANAASVELITNGAFDSGLSGWTVDNPGNYLLSTQSFDIDGNASFVSSNALISQTAGGYGSPDINIGQSISLVAGTEYSFFASIASQAFNSSNYSGGQITARLGNLIIDSFDFGNIAANTSEFATLNSIFTASTTGLFSFDIQIFRPYTQNSTTPLQFIDNISLTYENQNQSVPEPISIALLAIGFAGMFGISRKKTMV